MATEVMINGKRCRRYNIAKLWVSEDGKYAAVDSIMKTGFSDVPYRRNVKIHLDSNNERYVRIKIRNKFYDIYIKDAVYTCFCPPAPNDGSRYVVQYKDGDSANLHYKNLELKQLQLVTRHTSASSVKLSNGLKITSKGEVFYGKNKEYISDCVGDADTDLMRCIDPYVSNPEGRGKLWMDDLMAIAGYVSGERYSLGNPRVLHKDYNPTNFDCSNLEWVESTDTRYIEYQKKVEEWKHQRNIELNPGRTLHPGW